MRLYTRVKHAIRRLLRLNDKRTYWFKRRRYGWGWTPVTWQGWTVLVGALALILVNSLMLDNYILSPLLIGLFVINTLAVAVVLFLVSYAKGPKPKWRWGKGPKDTEDDI